MLPASLSCVWNLPACWNSRLLIRETYTPAFMNLSPFKDQLHFRLFALKAAATLDFLYLNLQPSSTDSSSLSLQWRSSFRLKGRCLQWPETSAAVWSVYCHLLAQAPSKNPSGLRRRLWLRLGAEIHTRTHTSMQTDAQKTHTWGKTCSWRLWWRFSFFFFFLEHPPRSPPVGIGVLVYIDFSLSRCLASRREEAQI